MRTYFSPVAVSLVAVTLTLAPTALKADSDPLPPSQVDASAIGNGLAVRGNFGLPIGRFLTIEGMRPATVMRKWGKVKSSSEDFLVDRLNGQPIRPPHFIRIVNVPALPINTHCIVNGYETGQMVGIPEDVLLKMGHKKPDPHVAVAWGWHFDVSFQAVKVVNLPHIRVNEGTAPGLGR